MKLFATLILSLSLLSAANAQVNFEKDDRILLYGNSFVERLQESGHFEAAIQLAHPDKQLKFRSLAWTGDEVGYRLRPERYVSHLKRLLERWPANWVILGFGMNESYAGEAGIPAFREDLIGYLREMARRHPEAQVILLSPIAIENSAERNAVISQYVEAMRQVAETSQVQLIDLFAESRAAYEKYPEPLTENGIHLNALGNERIGQTLAQWFGANENSSRIDAVAQAVSRKARHVADVVRPVNTVLYFGVRGRPDEYAAEIPRFHELIEKADAVTHAMVADSTVTFDPEPVALPPLDPLPVSEIPIPTPAELESQFVVADGFAVNLFASEEQFPELRNPEQIAFDERGRLWVVTMPSFPGTVPGAPREDKIIVLEDTDRDGRADQSTVFAEGLNVPDGLAFHEDGVIISHQPRLVFMRDTDGDGKADWQRELLRGIDVTDAHHGGMIAMGPLGHVMFCDGVFHRSQIETPHGVTRGIDATTYRFDLRSGSVEREYQTLTPNPWKVTWDRWGNLFQMYGDGYLQDGNAMPWTPFGVYHPFGRGISIRYGKGSAAAVISSPNFPDEYQQGMATAVLLRKCFVSISKHTTEQGYFRASDRVDVLSSPNQSFRPVDIAFGLDGGMYVSDFCSRIIGHAQHPMRDPRWDGQFGRIWRVTHTAKPTVSDWPKIAGATTDELLELLKHPQDLVRDHARRKLRATSGVAAKLDAFLAANPSEKAVLEVLWVLHDQGEVRPAELVRLLESKDFRMRAAGVNLIRFQAEKLETAAALLKPMASDPHPRVRAQVIHAVSHLQRQDQAFAAILGLVETADSEDLRTMLADASHGTFSGKTPEVPVLEIPGGAKLPRWLLSEGEKTESPFHFENYKGKAKAPAVMRTFVVSPEKRRAILSIKHSYVKVLLNGVPVIASANWWSSESNAQVELKGGLNEIRVEYVADKRSRGYAPIFLFDPLGSAIPDLDSPADDAELLAQAASYDEANRVDENSIRIGAVPNQLAFSPTEIRIEAGRKVTLTFDNPDLQIHNLVIVQPGAAEEVGLLADQMAQDPKAMSRHYVPDSDKVIWSSPLVMPGKDAAAEFTAPKKPGSYPFICTFPGHWRVMRGVLVVE